MLAARARKIGKIRNSITTYLRSHWHSGRKYKNTVTVTVFITARRSVSVSSGGTLYDEIHTGGIFCDNDDYRWCLPDLLHRIIVAADDLASHFSSGGSNLTPAIASSLPLG
jgi:hypothetical protein